MKNRKDLSKEELIKIIKEAIPTAIVVNQQ